MLWDRLFFNTFKIIRPQKICSSRMLSSFVGKDGSLFDDSDSDIEVDGLSLFDDSDSDIEIRATGSMCHILDPFLFESGLKARYLPQHKPLVLEIAYLSPAMTHARRTFNLIHNTDIYNWNTAIRRYAQGENPDSEHPVSLDPDSYMHENLPEELENLVDRRAVEKGHCVAIKNGIDSLGFVENALVRFYGACGEPDSAYELLKSMRERNIVAWNSVLIGYVMDRKFEWALNIYEVILLDGFEADEFTLVCALTAAAHTAMLHVVKWARADMFKLGLDKNLNVANAELYCYAKCDYSKTAQELFDKLENRNVVSWNCMIVGMAVNNFSERAFELFEEFERESLVPNEITFAGLLFACCHLMLLGKAEMYFERMTKEFGIQPTIIHYACMVALYCTNAPVKLAYEFVKQMPIKPPAMIWRMIRDKCFHPSHDAIKGSAESELAKSSDRFVLTETDEGYPMYNPIKEIAAIRNGHCPRHDVIKEISEDEHSPTNDAMAEDEHRPTLDDAIKESSEDELSDCFLLPQL